jgi:hypothetical protein
MGYAAGLSCLETVANAATELCAGVGGVSAQGAIACVSVGATTAPEGEPGTAVLNLERTNEVGVVGFSQARVLPQCELYGLDYWAPVQGVYVLALVTILCARWLLSYFRTRESL